MSPGLLKLRERDKPYSVFVRDEEFFVGGGSGEGKYRGRELERNFYGR